MRINNPGFKHFDPIVCGVLRSVPQYVPFFIYIF